MSSSFKGKNLFGSGAHRFRVGEQGESTLPSLYFDNVDSSSVPIGLIEFEVTVTGRLAAASDAALWVLRDAITAELAHPPVPGALVDHTGRTHAGMSLLRYEEADRVDRGRVISLGYVANFRRFALL